MNKSKPLKKKPFEKLTITDNYMFQAVMRDSDRVRPLLEMVLGKIIRKIIVVETEKSKESGYQSRGIRMDVYIEDDENSVYDVEMQTTKKRFLGKRFRYYQSAIDVEHVTKGEDFGKLKTSHIIFITTYDPFGRGWFLYPFSTLCPWDSSIKMRDSSFRYVLNTKGTTDANGHPVSPEIKELLAYMDGKSPQSEYTRMLDDAVKEVKQSEERRLEYMSINTFAADERIVGRYSTYVQSIRDTTYTDDILAGVLKIKPKTINNIRLVIKEHPDWDDDDIADEVIDLEDDDDLPEPWQESGE